jgi:hypothetical protein
MKLDTEITIQAPADLTLKRRQRLNARINRPKPANTLGVLAVVVALSGASVVVGGMKIASNSSPTGFWGNSASRV